MKILGDIAVFARQKEAEGGESSLRSRQLYYLARGVNRNPGMSPAPPDGRAGQPNDQLLFVTWKIMPRLSKALLASLKTPVYLAHSQR